MSRPAIITLTTDFGLNDHFVGAMKGVMLQTAPDAQIVDISHAVQPFDILDGALTISQAYSYFPSGTVHVVIVDPGVGTARRPIILTGDRHLFVAPDNGVLSLIYDREERTSVRHVTAEHYFLQPRSNTFHGRDIFAPVAASLARGVEANRFGDEITDYVRFAAPRPKPVDERTLRGIVLKVDRFGNLITNITPADMPDCSNPRRRHSRLRWAKDRPPAFATTTRKARPPKCLASWAAWATWKSRPIADRRFNF